MSYENKYGNWIWSHKLPFDLLGVIYFLCNTLIFQAVAEELAVSVL